MSYRVAYKDREGHTGYLPGTIHGDAELKDTIREHASKQLDRGAIRVLHRQDRSVALWSDGVFDTTEFWGVEV
jgi:hypothetical protein